MMNDRSLPIAINQTDEKYISVQAQLTQNITETAKFKTNKPVEQIYIQFKKKLCMKSLNETNECANNLSNEG